MTTVEAPIAGPTGRDRLPGGSRRAGGFVGWTADQLTLVGFLFSPLYVPNLGGRFGIVASDILLGLAALVRLLHVATEGVVLAKLRRSSYLLGVLSVFALAGVVSSFANGQNPMAWPYFRMVIATAGSVFLVATYGGSDWPGDRKRLLQAYALGCAALGVSTLTGPAVQGRRFGWSIHPNAMGHSCFIGLFVCVWLWDNATTTRQRAVAAAAGLSCFYGVMQSGSRGGLLAVGVAGTIYLCLRGDLRVVLVTVAAAWLAIVLVGGGVVRLPYNNPLTRLIDGEQTGANLSDQARRELLAEDMEVISRSPVFGDGFEDDEKIINVHVVYLQGWVAAGATAAFCLMLIGVSMLLLPFLMRRKDIALGCGATAIAIAWLFTNILNLRDQWLFLGVAFASAQSVYVLRGGRFAPAARTASSTATSTSGSSS